jgi:transcriptional regulator with XRE-family HTH domain
MVTRIRKGARTHLYVKEWREHRGLSLEQVGGRLGVEKNTVWRWENEQHRLNPGKQAELAYALGIEAIDLWFLPPGRSLDAMLKDEPSDVRSMAVDIVSRLIKRAS